MSPALSRVRTATRSRRIGLATAVGIAALAVPLVAGPPEHARAEPGGEPAVAEASLAAEAASPAPDAVQRVTLLTGDVVTLTGSGPGAKVEVEQARRPGRVRFMTQAGSGGVYVLPSDAIPAIDAGWLDRELFNVSRLAEIGYADDDSDELPVIVSYEEPSNAKERAPRARELVRRADRLPGTSEVIGLPSINGAGVGVAKDDVLDFWLRLRGDSQGTLDRQAPGAPPAGVAAVWLDGAAEVVLDESVPLVGAPVAWEAGFDGTGVTVAVLDTGVDRNHPDLADRITAAESFVDGLSPEDGHGHGTHVASTIAGTGAAGGDRYRGVAPGANLVSGRICDDSGEICPFSSMIAAMEWATTEQNAAVVSMSVSGNPTDGTDPVSLAVDSLTESTGALFVIAAGNWGRDEAIGSPGSAGAALTVGATDDSDALAGFSSRGPRIGDLALKPDIAAPGVEIVAARADGTGLGHPVDDLYTSSSGTSMATPHVSGAAAILAQRHPGLAPVRMKAALMSTSLDAGHTVYQQGAGRLDVGRVASQDVLADTPSVDFALVPLPKEGEPEHAPIEREITFTNLSDEPVELSLESSLRTTTGDAVPDGALTTEPSVTVPARGSAVVPVTLDPAGLGEAGYTGAVVATTDTGVSLRTPVGLVRKPPMVDLTIHTSGRTGEPVVPWGQDIIRLDGPGGRIPPVHPNPDGSTTVRVPAGVYSVMQAVDWVDEDSRLNSAMLLEPEVTVATDTDLVLDARDAEQIEFRTPRPAEPLNNRSASAYQRTTERGIPLAASIHHFTPVGAWTRMWATPTDEVETGEFRFWTQALLGKSEVDLMVTEPQRRALHPVAPLHFEFTAPSGTGELLRYQDFHPGWVPFTGEQRLRLVDVGTGTRDELADVDVEGRLALMAADARFEDDEGRVSCGVDIAKIQQVRDAGAAGIVVYPAPDHPCGLLPIPLPIVQETATEPLDDIGIPNVHLSTHEAATLRQELFGQRPVTVRVSGTPETPYSYVLKIYEEGRIPDSLDYRLTDRDLGEVELDYHAPTSTGYSEDRTVWKVDDVVRIPMDMAYSVTTAFYGPRHRTEYFGPVANDVLHTRTGYGRQGGRAPAGYYNRVQRESDPQVFAQPDRSHQRWYVAPKTPGPAMASDAVHGLFGDGSPASIGPCHVCRQDGYLYAPFRMVTGPPGHRQHDFGSGTAEYYAEESTGDLDLRLFRNGTEVHSDPGLPWDLFPMPDEGAHYRLTGTGPQTDVTWTFDSKQVVEDTRRDGYMCFLEMAVGSTDPCAPMPVVYVSYDMGDSLALDNTTRAPGAQEFTVHAYHAPSDVPMPEISQLQLQVSYGDGDWRPVRLRDLGDGGYRATVVHPPQRRRHSDWVDLRVQARDEDGNGITQVTREAYRLRGR